MLEVWKCSAAIVSCRLIYHPYLYHLPLQIVTSFILQWRLHVQKKQLLEISQCPIELKAFMSTLKTGSRLYTYFSIFQNAGVIANECVYHLAVPNKCPFPYKCLSPLIPWLSSIGGYKTKHLPGQWTHWTNITNATIHTKVLDRLWLSLSTPGHCPRCALVCSCLCCWLC